MENAVNQLLIISMVLLAVMILFCLIRAIKGPKITDRIVSINMIGTMTIIIIAILSVYKNESYLADVCLIYAMISFLAVVVLTKVYMGVYREQEAKEAKKKDAENTADSAGSDSPEKKGER